MSAADEYSLDLGDEYSRPCGSPTPAAQRWFDRGMLWIHGFNHAEAGYCFGRSFAADGSCALARWGEALALGPNYNDPILDDDRAAAALTLAQEAVGLLDASEEGLGAASVAAARALPSRLGPAGSSREDQDKAYAEAMEPVYSAFGAEDADIAFLFADALMQLNPWRLWTGAEAAIRSGDFETQRSAALRSRRSNIFPGLTDFVSTRRSNSKSSSSGCPAPTALKQLLARRPHFSKWPTANWMATDHLMNGNPIFLVAWWP